MKPHLLIPAIAGTLLLAACSAPAIYVSRPSPESAGNIHRVASDVQELKSVSTVAPDDIISWLAYTLLASVSSEQTTGLHVSAQNTEGDPRTGAVQDPMDGASTKDPWGIRAKASLRAPVLPAALAPRSTNR